MSGRTAEYLRVMLTPQQPDGTPADVAPSIASLSTRARHLAEVLSNLAFSHDNARVIPVPVLAQRMAVSDRTVQRAADELAAAGVIRIDRGGGGHESPNAYRFPLSSVARVVPSGDTGDTSELSPAVTPVTASGDTGDTHKYQQEPVGISTRRDPARAAPAASDSTSTIAPAARPGAGGVGVPLTGSMTAAQVRTILEREVAKARAERIAQQGTGG